MDFFRHFGAVNWVASLVAGLLFSILANLLTGPVQNNLARLSSAWAVRRAHKLERELRAVERMTMSAFELTAGLVTRGLYGAICFALASAVTALSNVPERYMSDTTSDVLTGIGIVLYLMALGIAFEMLRVMARVRNFPTHLERVDRSIAALKKSAR